jgi:predicted dehydrogenase
MNVAMIGTGSRSTVFTQLCLSGFRSDVKVKALVDIDVEKMRRYAKAYYDESNAPNLYSDYNEMLENEEIDAVFICASDTAHKDIAIACMKKDKHVFLEKPMATTLEDCFAIYEESRRHDRIFRMGFVLRYTNVYEKIKEIVSSGILGQLISVEAKEIMGHLHAGSFFRRWHRFGRNNGGFLNAKCSHDMDILNWIIGDEPLYLSAFGGRSHFNPKPDAAEKCADCGLKHSCRYFYKPSDYGAFNCVEDMCVFNCEKDIVDHETLVLEYPGHVTASFTVSMFGDRATRTMVLFGTEATLYADLAGLSITIGHVFPHDRVSYEFSGADSGHGGGDRGIFADFIDSVASGRKEDRSDARAGMISSVMALAAEQSMSRKKVVNLQELLEKAAAESGEEGMAPTKG